MLISFLTITLVLVPQCIISNEIIKRYNIQQENILKGKDVVDKVITIVNFVLPDDKGILKEIAKTESNDGEHPNTFREQYHGGIWQVDFIGFQETQLVSAHPKLKEHHQCLFSMLGINWMFIDWEDLRIPLLSAIAARLLLLCKPDPIPTDILGRANYWKKHYNTESGKGSVEHYLRCNGTLPCP